MKVLIETYRGWDIFFNTETENFYCHSDIHDTDKTKTSYTTTKKFIDDYIKENNNFKPVVVTWIGNAILAKDRFITLTGIRKDGRFTYEQDGAKKQLSEYDEKNYIVYNPDNDAIFEQIDDTKNQIKALYEKQKGLEQSITGMTLAQYKNTL